MEWLSDVYVVCALVGGTVLVVQTVLMVVGGGHDVDDLDPDAGHDAHHGGGDTTFVKWLSLKTVVSYLTFFGLAGLASEKAGLARALGFGVAIVSGTAAIFLVGFLMASLSRLQSRGNLDLRNAVGTTARVYLRVPGGRAGKGKVTVVVQGRSMEVEAVTAGRELPTGCDVRVVAMPSADTLEVASTDA